MKMSQVRVLWNWKGLACEVEKKIASPRQQVTPCDAMRYYTLVVYSSLWVTHVLSKEHLRSMLACDILVVEYGTYWRLFF